jgi:arylformamidase
VTVFAGFDRRGIDLQYSPSKLVDDLPSILHEYAARSARARAELPMRTLRYGPGSRMTLDFFPARPAAPMFVYVHGGFWQEMSKDDFGFPALDLVPAGVAFAALGYGLAPHHNLDEIVASVRLGLRWLVAHAVELDVDPGRIHLGGGSAGAHLVAMALLDGWAPAGLFAGATLVSGVYDLEPVRHSYVNAPLRLDAKAAARNSPIRHLPARLPPLILARGGRETGEFARQHTEFAAAASGRGGPVHELVVSHRHHFDLTFDLADPATALGSAVLAQVTPRCGN